MSRFLTIGEIARRFGRDRFQVAYVLRTRSIRPEGMAGNARVFSEESVEQIGRELEQIDARRAAVTAQ